MNEHDRQQLECLKSSVECVKNFNCIKNKFKNLCIAEFDEDNRKLECQEDRTDQCKFAVPDNGMFMCTCELRIFIEKNLDQWMPRNAAY